MLRARPEHLARAVEALPPPRREPAEEPRRLEEQRQRLLAIPAEQLSRYRINPRALEILPTLAVEVRHAALRERVIGLAAAQAEQLPWSTLARLIPWVYEDASFRRAIHARARKDEPRAPLPRWLVLHWREALGRQDPPALLAEAALLAEPVLARLLSALQLAPDAPLGRAVLAAAVARQPDAALDAQPYTETLRFIEHSPADPLLRAALLRRILARHGGRVREPADLVGPQAELHAVARHLLLGGPEESPGLWQGVPALARRAGRWYQRLASLQAAFPPADARVDAWRPWLRHITRADSLPLIDVVCVQLADFAFVEAREAPHLCRVYALPDWLSFAERLAAAGHPIPPPRPDARLDISPENRAAVDVFLREHLGLAP